MGDCGDSEAGHLSSEGEVPLPGVYPRSENPRSAPPAKLRSRELVPTCSVSRTVVPHTESEVPRGLTGGLAALRAALYSAVDGDGFTFLATREIQNSM